jgi:hypothetical protein
MIGTIDSSGSMIDHGDYSGNWVSFGEDINKELYIIDISGGSIYKIKGGQIIGTEDFSMENKLSMLPNPASHTVSFNLKNDKLQAIQLFSVRGSLVYSEENLDSNNKTVSIENLNPGIYFAKIISEKGQSIVKKLIIE